MKAGPHKAIVSLISVAMLGLACLRPAAALARAKRPKADPAKQTIEDFLSSVELAGSAYSFDHDADGTADMTVYPLITSEPDLKTKYITLREALGGKQVVLKEKLAAQRPTRTDPPSSFNIVAMGISRPSSGSSRPSYSSTYRPGYSTGYRPGYSRPGSGYSSGMGYSSGLGYSSSLGFGGRSTFFQGGGMLGGGWQNRGFMRGGTMGGYPGYGSPYQGYGPSGSRGIRYSPYGKAVDHRQQDLDDSPVITAAAVAGLGSEAAKSKSAAPEAPVLESNPEVELDAFCFEEWRLIEQSRFRGEPEYFSYAGLASPYVRRQLVAFSNQTNAHKAIDRELRRLGVPSKTKAFADVLKDPQIKQVIDYYTSASRKVLGQDKNMSGLVVATRNSILCADVYSSPALFKKMFGELIQSAALGVYRNQSRRRKRIEESDVEQFLNTLKGVEKLKKDAGQTYKLFYPKIVSAAELSWDRDGTKVVHLEAYPR
ncbi:MAG: ARPP-1 family domain-containing protein [Planctomycetota bacterium]|jgi:hypothetical protein